jgi:RNA polymerase sigma-70 factor (ECF subfamily)
MRFVGEAEAEDLTQSVMMKIADGLGDFRGDSSVSTWIYRIATNAALDKFRANKGDLIKETDLESLGEDAPLAAATPSLEKAAIRDEMNACIREFIERLPENYRSVIVLSDLEGFTNAEIAAILGMSLDTVKIRLHRAREGLRKALDSGCNFYRSESDDLACDRKPATTVVMRRRR